MLSSYFDKKEFLDRSMKVGGGMDREAIAQEPEEWVGSPGSQKRAECRVLRAPQHFRALGFEKPSRRLGRSG